MTGHETNIPRQFKADAPFPVRAEYRVALSDCADFDEYMKRNSKLQAEFCDLHEAVLTDPQWMTDEFLRHTVDAHDRARAVFGNAPFKTARMAAAQENPRIEGYRRELERRAALAIAAE